MTETAKKLDYPTPAHAERDKLLALAAALTAKLSIILQRQVRSGRPGRQGTKKKRAR